MVVLRVVDILPAYPLPGAPRNPAAGADRIRGRGPAARDDRARRLRAALAEPAGTPQAPPDAPGRVRRYTGTPAAMSAMPASEGPGLMRIALTTRAALTATKTRGAAG